MPQYGDPDLLYGDPDLLYGAEVSAPVDLTYITASYGTGPLAAALNPSVGKTGNVSVSVAKLAQYAPAASRGAPWITTVARGASVVSFYSKAGSP